MKLIFTLSLFFFALGAAAQSVSLTVFNNGGQQFFVIVNGIRQNSLPETNVKIGGMTTGSYEIKLIFADGKSADLNKKVWLDTQGDYVMRVKEKGSKRKLKFFGIPEEQVPAGKAINYRPDDQTVYSDQPATQAPQPATGGSMNPGSIRPTGDVQTQTQGGQVTTDGRVIPPAVNASGTAQAGTLSSEMNGTGVNVTIQQTGAPTTPVSSQPTTVGTTVVIPDPNIPTGFGIHINADGSTPSGINSSSTTTTTTANGQTVTQTTTILQNGESVTTINEQPKSASAKTMAGTYTKPATVTNAAGTPICTEVLSDTEGFMKEIADADFENDKRGMIEFALANACLSSDQAYRIVNALTFEADRMSVSKFLYLHLTDKNAGQKLIELMTFDSSKKELKAFMDAH